MEEDERLDVATVQETDTTSPREEGSTSEESDSSRC